MTQTTTSTGLPPEAATASLNPSDILMGLIVALLAPMFLGVAAGNIAMARMAAIETVNAYRSRSHADLIAVAQIIAYGLAALGSLSMSMADDISPSMALRLRGNAIALNRATEQNRRALRENPVPHHAALAENSETWNTVAEDDIQPEPGVFLSAHAAQVLTAEADARLRDAEKTIDPVPAQGPKTAEKRHQEMWAIVMVKEAAEITASIPNLPPAERRAASIRAAALSSTANRLLTGIGTPIPPPLTGDRQAG